MGSLVEIEHALDQAEQELRAYDALRSDGLFGSPRADRGRLPRGPLFALQCFRTDMALGREHYLGERIVDGAGQLLTFASSASGRAGDNRSPRSP